MANRAKLVAEIAAIKAAIKAGTPYPPSEFRSSGKPEWTL